MNTRWLAVKQLDEQSRAWRAISECYGKPNAGWIKTVRTALRMSLAQLGNRLGLSVGRIVQLENAETHDSVTLRALRQTANALGCDLVYAFVPKNYSSFEMIIKARADAIAQESIKRVAHTMALENQAVKKESLRKQQNALAKNIFENFDKSLWNETKG